MKLPSVDPAYGGSTATFNLKRAILIYEADSRGITENIVTVHDIGRCGSCPTILPGKCATPEAIEELNRALTGPVGQKRESLQFLNPFILAISPTRIIWHLPPCIRTLWFQPSDPDQAAFFKKMELSGEDFPQPHLIFITNGKGLSVFAVKPKGGRPTPNDPVFVAPYMNVYEGGALCTGSARIPKRPTPELVPKFEKAFFESNFTHTNLHGVKLCNFPGGHDALWASLKGKKVFPNKVLVPIKGHTVRSILT